MEIGISIYANEEYDIKTNIEYIDLSNSLGISNLFTSFNAIIHSKTNINHAIQIIEYAKSRKINIMVDASPRVFKWLNASPKDLKPFYKIGISDIRCDYGFDTKDLAEMTNNSFGIGVVINASTVKRKEIEEMLEQGAYKNNIKACHNFYPRKFTGLSKNFFIRKTTMLKSYGIKVSAFIPSQNGKRGPLYEGLPTIENHRNISAHIAAKEFAYGGITDVIYFSDAYASEEELQKVLNIKSDIIEIEAKFLKNISEIEKSIIFCPYHVNRFDAPDYIIRSSKFRLKVSQDILPFNCTDRNINTVTIDNKEMGRYMGELQIIKKPLPADYRVNVVGEINEENICLLDYISPGSKFKFIKKGD